MLANRECLQYFAFSLITAIVIVCSLISMENSYLIKMCCLCYQLRLMTEDGGVPPCTNTTVAVLNVNRNLYDPVFSQLQYAATILEIASLRNPILQVSGSDRDSMVQFLL